MPANAIHRPEISALEDQNLIVVKWIKRFHCAVITPLNIAVAIASQTQCQLPGFAVLIGCLPRIGLVAQHIVKRVT